MVDQQQEMDLRKAQRKAAQTAQQSLHEFIRKNFELLQIAVIDANNWMAMILLDGQSQRFRCTNGTIIDEATVGD